MTVKLVPAISYPELQRVFESAVSPAAPGNSIHDALWYRTPIGRRPRILDSPVETEKHALSSAAQALAQLWKVSAHPGR